MQSEEMELHFTVAGDINEWLRYCKAHGMKPIFIKLLGKGKPQHRWQLMCSMRGDTVARAAMEQAIQEAGFRILRVKCEVPQAEEKDVRYWEAHLKYRPVYEGRVIFGEGAHSENLLTSCAFQTFRACTREALEAQLTKAITDAADEVEIEAVLHDSNPAMDDGWERGEVPAWTQK